MNIPDLEAFIAVVETGSIVGASARLNLTQPGVTRRIQNLEIQLDTVLLDRQSKPLKPTAAGREAYEHGRKVLSSLEDLKAGVSPDGDIKGEFRLGIMPYLSDAALALPLDRLRSEFPQLTLRIVSGWSPRLVEQVSRNELDAVALCLADGMRPPDDLASEELGTQAVLLVAAAEIGVPNPASLSELSRFPWVMNESGCGFRGFIRHKFEASRLPFQVGVEALSADLRLSLVARGHGIGIVTPAAFAGSPWRDKIEVIDSPEFNPRVRSWLLHRTPAGRLARPIAVFREALLESLKLPVPLLA
ncbi:MULTISPECIES: LysR family transcriptional regulator [unclassified Beijerinckia]|uniref:LysR family transcriptional regulator n=1 Tax=unclassified Beijerinckia TaxID=2638183 RepID=UPI000895CB3F|nr:MULTISPECIES: LysR family transcriptional regulator [unclassified Beijerinckia]MDH7795120.1 DNA-binding transcriptional LysR family regulator [Beijerinckia sp. GAS462]SEB88334.1 DNA-binding transcriptional regulator, LysR family [Beijerinckia sp. 28-YEA-48]